VGQGIISPGKTECLFYWFQPSSAGPVLLQEVKLAILKDPTLLPSNTQ